MKMQPKQDSLCPTKDKTIIVTQTLTAPFLYLIFYLSLFIGFKLKPAICLGLFSFNSELST